MKSTKPLQTNEHVLKTWPLAAVALTLFYFCNTLGVLSRFWLQSRTLLEMNCVPNVEKWHIHLPSQKTWKTWNALLPRFWTPSGPPLANLCQSGGVFIERIEARHLPLQREASLVTFRGGKWTENRIRIDIPKIAFLDLGGECQLFRKRSLKRIAKERSHVFVPSFFLEHVCNILKASAFHTGICANARIPIWRVWKKSSES